MILLNKYVAKIDMCCYFVAKMLANKSFCSNNSDEDMFGPVF